MQLEKTKSRRQRQTEQKMQDHILLSFSLIPANMVVMEYTSAIFVHFYFSLF